MTELTHENYSFIQGLVLANQISIQRITGLSHKEAHVAAIADIASLAGVLPSELETYLTVERNNLRAQRLTESTILTKVELIRDVDNDHPMIANLLIKELSDVPPTMGKRLTFNSEESAMAAMKLLYKITRKIGWGGVPYGDGKLRYYRSRRIGKRLEIWRLA